MRITTLSLALAVAVILPALASADTFDWAFISTNDDLDGWGTLNATLSSTPGVYDITGGSGTVFSQGVNYSVTIAPCATYDDSNPCVIQNSDGGGANITYDNLLYPGNSPADQLDSNGVVLTPGPQGTQGIELWGSEDGLSAPQFFFGYTPPYTGGYDNLSTPFNVTPEPASFTLMGLGLATLGFVRWRKKTAPAKQS